MSKDLKIAICFGLIIGVILSVCNLCFASESVEIFSVSNCSIGSAGQIAPSSNNVYYFRIEPGYVYSFTNSAPGRYFGFSNDVVSINDTISDVGFIDRNETISFTYSNYSYVYFNVTYNDISYVNVTREPLVGMSNFIDNIAYSLSIGDLSSVWVLVVPVLAISVLLGLGFYLLKRLLNRIKRAKGGA